MSMRKIYRELARKHNVSITEVKREMQAAIDHAYRSPKDGTAVILQSKIPRHGEIPTSEEFVRYAAEKAKEPSE